MPFLHSPYLCCNECGGLDTEWVDLTNMRGIVKQALPTKGAFGDPEFRNTQGDYFAVEIEVSGMDASGTLSSQNGSFFQSIIISFYNWF